MALNSEIGLYFDFKVEDGMPYGCPGFKTFDAEHWDLSNIQDSFFMKTDVNY